MTQAPLVSGQTGDKLVEMEEYVKKCFETWQSDRSQDGKGQGQLDLCVKYLFHASAPSLSSCIRYSWLSSIGSRSSD